MKILLATNYLKGSLSAIEAANIIEKSLLEEDKSLEITKIPIADGGDGTLDAVKLYTDCEERTSVVTDPLGRKISAKWLIINYKSKKTAVIETAQACGLSLLKPEEYNPMKTTTFGVGELIIEAVKNNCKQIILTAGGSSTNDGGTGILEALGIKFLDENKKPIPRGGGGLSKLDSVDLSGLNPKLKEIKIIVACDVKNPLCGKNGASYVYAPQKGATEEQIKILDKNLSKFADITTKITGNDYRNLEGAGAAGGISFGLKSFLHAKLISGFDFVAEVSSLEEKIKSANAVITTEGRFDFQTLQGKAPYKIAQLAKKYDIPVFLITGSAEKNLNFSNSGIKKIFSLAENNISIQDAINNAPSYLENITKRVIPFLKL